MWRKLGSFVGMMVSIFLFEKIAVNWFIYEAGKINWSVVLLAGISGMVGAFIFSPRTLDKRPPRRSP